MQLDLTPEADADIDDAMLWYFEEDPEFAARFAIEVERVLDLILENPRAWTEIESGIRRVVLRAVTHQHRMAGHWRDR